jgi:hypothetical protein
MAKTKTADASFTLGKWHLARVTVVRWASLPGVGAKEQNVLVLQVKLAVLYRLPDPPDTTPEFVGRECVVYILCTKDRAPVTTRGREFLYNAGVALTPGVDGDLKHKGAWFQCQFGVPDPIHGFQSVIEWKSADAAQVDIAASRALHATIGTPNKLGLDFQGRGSATRNGVQIDFSTGPITWDVLQCLARRHPDPYPAKDLVLDAWAEAEKRIPAGIEAAARTAIHKLRRILQPHGLGIPRAKPGQGWRLEEI